MIGDESTQQDPPSDDGDFGDDPRILAVVEEYMQELEAGRAPDRREYIERYPELSDSIAHCLEGLALMHSGVKAKPRMCSGERTVSLGVGDERLVAPLGDFQIVRELARGGMGIVYEAIQLSLGRRVALKVLPFAANLETRHLQRFKIEAQAAALLHHTHIVPIYAVGCERGLHFYAMQLIQGDSLATVIKQLREREGRSQKKVSSSNIHDPSPLPSATPAFQSLGNDGETRGETSFNSTLDVSRTLTGDGLVLNEHYCRRVAHLMVQAAEGLDHAHQSGVVHRDVKPANLILDATGNVWITDFGLAQLQSDNGITRSGDFVGTFRYMSPEQMSGQRTVIDHRADIYSLGATMYELLTLESAFPAENHQELLYQVLHAEPRKLRQWNQNIPPELETIVLKALSKNLADRYRSAGDFAADIKRYLDNKPILAQRPSLVDRAKKWSRRHPSVVIAGAILLFAIAVASLVSNRLIVLEQRRTEEALDREKDRANEAEKSFQQAREAVNALFQISQEELVDKPGIEGTRKRILEIVLSYYEDFIEQSRNDAASQAELSRVQSEVQKILNEINLLQREMHLRLLENDAIVEELKLTEEQEKKLDGLQKEWHLERQKFFEEVQNLTEEARRSRMVQGAKKHEASLAGLLNTRQQERFRQISIQSQGLFAFKEPEIVRKLDLTSEQRAKIRDIERELFSRAFRPGGPSLGEEPPPGGPPGGPPDRPPGGPGLGDPRMISAAVGKVVKILKAEQQQTWKELIGPEFSGFGDERFPGPFGPPRP